MQAASQPRRPGFRRHASSASYVSQSPSDGNGHSNSYKAPGHKPQKHVVGKLGRNVSFGKNLHKLSSHANAQEGDGVDARQQTHAQSGGVSAPNSLRPTGNMKRNASSTAVKRNTSHTVLRKNFSSGHLPRHGSSKNVSKAAKAEAPQMKRSHSNPQDPKIQQHSPPAKPLQPTVRFDVGEDEGQDDGWTEDSASQSPEETRDNTRNNSVILDTNRTLDGTQESRPSHKREPSDPQVRFAQPSTSPPSSAAHHSLSGSPVATRDYAPNAQKVNGSSSHHPPARHPDADIITARLLQRAPHNAAAPQTSTVSATVRADAHTPQSLSQSAGSTLNETPGKDLVSRFINGSGSSGNTPRDSSFLPVRFKDRDQGSDGEAGDNAPKRNKSVPNMAHPLSAASSASHSRSASQTQAQNSAFGNPEMHPSRTQQKLWLQRASSAIEPQKMVPAILPRASGPPLLTSGVNYNSTVDSTGRLDPRLQRQFDTVQLEYKAIRRYRNPLAEAIRKLETVDSHRRNWVLTGTSIVAPSSSASMNGHRNGTKTPVHSSNASTSASTRASGAATSSADRDRLEVASRRSRVSFDVPSQNDDENEADEEDEDGSIESEGNATIGSQSHRDEVLEICRRMWDMSAAGDSG